MTILSPLTLPPSTAVAPAASRLRVGLLGGGLNTGNLGVSALTVSAVTLIRQARPDAEIVLVDYGCGPAETKVSLGAEVLRLPIVYLRFSKKPWQPNHVLRLIVQGAWRPRGAPTSSVEAPPASPIALLSSIDLFVALSGGDSFGDLYGLQRLFYVGLPQVAALALRRPLLQFPQTFGPFRSAISRQFARAILSRSSRVCCRDHESAHLLQRLALAPPGRISVGPDIAFALPAGNSPERRLGDRHELRPPNPRVGFNVSGLLWNGGYTGRNMFNLRCEYRDMVRAIARLLLGELNADLRLIPHVVGPHAGKESDESACRALGEELGERWPGRVAVLEALADPIAIKQAVGRCEFFVGSRMHACLAALSQGIPAVGLAYSGKFAGVFAVAGESERVLDLRCIGIADAESAIRAAFLARADVARELWERLPTLRADLRRMVATALSSSTTPRPA